MDSLSGSRLLVDHCIPVNQTWMSPPAKQRSVTDTSASSGPRDKGVQRIKTDIYEDMWHEFSLATTQCFFSAPCTLEPSITDTWSSLQMPEI